MIFRESTFVPEMDIVAADALNKEVTVCSPNLVAVAQILIPGRVFTMQNRVVLGPPHLLQLERIVSPAFAKMHSLCASMSRGPPDTRRKRLESNARTF